MKNIAIAVLLVALVGVSLYAAYGRGEIDTNRRAAPGDRPATTTAERTPPADGAVRPYRRDEIGWSFVDKGEDAETAAPQTQVSAVVRGKIYDLGTYDGSCVASEVAALKPREMAGAKCWFAGAGDEFVVLQPEPGSLQIRHRVVEEGTAEDAGAIGEFQTVVSI